MQVNEVQQEQIKQQIRMALEQLMPQLPAPQAHYWVIRLLFYRDISERAKLMPHQDLEASGIQVPESANFWFLYAAREEPSNDQRLNQALKPLSLRTCTCKGLSQL